MGDNGPHRHPGRVSLDPRVPLTLRERWHYLLGAALFFLLGTLAMDTLLFGILIPEVLFVAGWVYLAGAASDDRTGWGLFVGSVIVTAAAAIAFAAMVVFSDSFGGLLYFFLGAYLPTVYAPIVIAQAVVFTYLAARIDVGRRGPSVMIVLGSVALVIVAVVGLLVEASEQLALPVFFMPVGYALVAAGAWVESRQVHDPGELGPASSPPSMLGAP